MGRTKRKGQKNFSSNEKVVLNSQKSISMLKSYSYVLVKSVIYIYIICLIYFYVKKVLIEIILVSYI
jgi:hypothetical protein